MTIVSHTYKFIFLHARKTAGSSIESALARHMGRNDWLSLPKDAEPVEHPFFRTRNVTLGLPGERRMKQVVGMTGLVPALRIDRHATAAELKAIVGDPTWHEYKKIVVERNPWDRMISLWRYKTREGPPVSFEEFLRAVEAGVYPRSVWLNWPMYTIADRVVVDTVIRYEHLDTQLHQVMLSLGVPFDGGLPRLKSGLRGPDDHVQSLSTDQVDRIATLCHREIQEFGYRFPTVKRWIEPTD
jgi:hypothetical protein